jgi:hypothetical protein
MIPDRRVTLTAKWENIGANHFFGVIMKSLKKSYLDVFKNYEPMHIHSLSIDVRCHKSWETNLLCKNSHKNNKFQVQVH